MQEEIAIRIKNLSMAFGDRVVLDNVNLEVNQGEFVAILGPNGSGKSTLLKLLLGLFRPTAGSIQILGKAPEKGNSDKGYAPQHRTLEADLSLRARDVVGFGLDGNKWGIGFPSAQRKKKIDDVLKEVDMLKLADMSVGKLSGGEQQRLLIAQALLTDPKILLLDEPLSSLDINHAQAIVELLTQINESRKITILLVTHDVNPLLSDIDRVVYIAYGHAAIGKVEDIITDKKLSELYRSPVEVVKTNGRLFVVGEET